MFFQYAIVLHVRIEDNGKADEHIQQAFIYKVLFNDFEKIPRKNLSS